MNHGQRKLAEPKKFREKSERYRQAWAPHETLLLQKMTEILDVKFYRPVIDVTLAPYFGSKSTPLIINLRPSADEFVDVLTHELLHVLLTDNDKHQSNGPHARIDLMCEWKRLFGEEHDSLTLAHIPVHALHKYLYIDVLRAPERLERDIETVKKSPTGGAYVKAWDYVNNRDYTTVVNDLRKIYEAAG